MTGANINVVANDLSHFRFAAINAGVANEEVTAIFVDLNFIGILIGLHSEKSI